VIGLRDFEADDRRRKDLDFMVRPIVLGAPIKGKKKQAGIRLTIKRG
jgi:hypothetical protein